MRYFIVLLMVLVSLKSMAQGNSPEEPKNKNKVVFNIPEINLLDIESGEASPDIVLQVLSPNEAGLAPSTTYSGVNSIWINYTTVKKSGGNSTSKDIIVRISNGQLPAGLSLQLKAYEASPYGQGKKGSPKSEYVILTAVDQGLIGEIESSYTGNGAGKGHLVEYSLLVDENEYNGLDAALDNTEVTITYTLADS